MPNQFQRRHLNALASIVADIPGLTDYERRNVAAFMAYRLRAADSPGVNVDRFIRAACPVQLASVPVPVPVPVPAPVPEPVIPCGDCGTPATHMCGASSSRRIYTCDRHAMSGFNGTGCCRLIETENH